MLTVREVTQGRELAQYEGGWNRLLAAARENDFFYTYEWLCSWLECFWADRPAAFLLIGNSDALVGMAPFVRDDKGALWCSGSLVLPVNAHVNRATILYAGRPEDVLDVVLSHARSIHRWPKIALKGIRRGSPLLSKVSEVAEAYSLACRIREASTSPVVRIQTDWRGYLAGKKSHFRTELKRKRRILERAGRVAIRTITAPAECADAMRDVLEVERNSWKQAAGTSFVAQPSVGDFYGTVAQRCAEKGWLRLYVQYMNATPIAYILGVVYRNIYYALKTSYSEAYRHLSAGAVLFEYALRDAFEQGLEAFDFLGVESRWKNQMATDSISHVDVCLYSRASCRCRACQAYQQCIKPFVRRRLPFLLHVKRTLGSAIRAVD